MSQVSWLTEPAEVRFWRWVNKTDGCWLWAGAENGHGYGAFMASRAPKRMVAVHRFSWELVNGPIPDGLFACHRCDVRACVRPDHLFLGTHDDNMADMVSKGRQAYAEMCAAGHRWTPESTRYIVVNGRPARRCKTCRREKEGHQAVTDTHCRMCGRQLPPHPYKGHPRRYCDAQCREAFYKTQRHVA